MPAATKTKAPKSDNSVAKGKTASTSGTATPVSAVEKKDNLELLAPVTSGKPDKKVYDAEQEKIKLEIEGLQGKLNTVKDKIALATKSGAGNDRRNALRAELDTIRDTQSGNKVSRGKLLDQIKALQDNIQKKIKDNQNAKAKIPFKSVAEVDIHIKNLEKQVESGNMKLADEKRALQEISTSKRSRRVVEGFEADQQSIDGDRRTVEELRKQLDDPESKATSERYDSIKAELDDLKKEADEAYAGRSKLFEERDNLQNQLTTFYNAKRESAQRFRESNDRYYTKMNEERAKRAERARIQRVADEAQKKQEIAERLREEAEAPAFQAQIEDCQTLIDYLSGKSTGTVTYKSTGFSTKTAVAGVPPLDLRQVENQPEGLIARKKKGEDEDAYFVGKGKGKGKKGSSKVNETPEPNGASAHTAANGTLNIPLPTLSALLSLSIPPPASNADVPRVIEDLKTKKAWYEANQARVTAENVAKAETDIQRLTNSVKDIKVDEHFAGDRPNGEREYPAEPQHTPQEGDVPVVAVPSSEVIHKLESVQEQELAAE